MDITPSWESKPRVSHLDFVVQVSFFKKVREQKADEKIRENVTSKRNSGRPSAAKAYDQVSKILSHGE